MARQKPFRFVHTADLHLDSPLQSLAMRDSNLRNLIDGATRRALSQLVDVCIGESVDALIIAGDLYDGQQKSVKTAAAFSSEMRRLEASNIPVFLIKGNHDARSELTRDLQLPDNVHYFDGRGTPYKLGEDAAIHGVSFAKPHCHDSLYPKYRPAIDDRYNIGIMHTSLAGSDVHDAYAPCSIEDLKNHGFDYWALGHIHKRQVYSETPAVVMPGIPQGRDIGESGPRSITLVTLDGDKPPLLETRAVHSAEFERMTVTIDTAMDWTAIVNATDSSLIKARDNCLAEHLIARPILTGESSLYFELIDGRERLLEELKYRCESHENIWIDKIVFDISAPALTDSRTSDEVPVHQLINPEVLKSTELATVCTTELAALKRLLPASERTFLGKTEEEQMQWVQELLAEGANEVLARLQIETDHAS